MQPPCEPGRSDSGSSPANPTKASYSPKPLARPPTSKPCHQSANKSPTKNLPSSENGLPRAQTGHQARLASSAHRTKNPSRDLQLRVASFSACASFPIHPPQKHVSIYLHSPTRIGFHLEHTQPRHRFPRGPVRDLLGRGPPVGLTQAKFW